LIDPAQFYDQVDVIFEGVMPESDDVRKHLSDDLAVIVQLLPDEDAFKAPGTIYFSFPEEIIERWEHNPPSILGEEAPVDPRYLEMMKRTDKKLRSLTNIQDSDALYDALRSIDWNGSPDGYSVPVSQWNRKKNRLESFGYVIDIVIDLRTIYRHPDYVKGVICHELVEFSTKWNVLREHKHEIKKFSDVKHVIRKYLKSGYMPPSKQYYEHEEIVNREAKRLGFEKYIAVMEKHEIFPYNFK
jgi:hypothetical protein